LPTYSIYRVEGQKYHDPSADALEQAPYLPRDWRGRFSASAWASLTIIKTHNLPEHDGPAVYIVRNGPAAIDSYFHYHKKFSFEQPSLTDVIAGACEFGSWSDHYFGWNPRTRPDTLMLQYEDLVAQPEQVIPRLSDFLGITPSSGDLPLFSELKDKLPAFFRRGQNQDFLTAWTPGQLALFRQLHGRAMEELGYTIPPVEESPVGTAGELAASAARLHRLYLQELHHQGLCLEAREQLALQVKQLETQVAELSKRLSYEISHREAIKLQLLSRLLENRWVKLGITLGAVPRPGDAPGAQANSPSN